MNGFVARTFKTLPAELRIDGDNKSINNGEHLKQKVNDSSILYKSSGRIPLVAFFKSHCLGF